VTLQSPWERVQEPGSPRCTSCTAAPKTVAYPKTGALSRGSKVRQGHSGGLQPASQVAGHHLDLQATKDRFSQAIHTGSTLIVST
jgi:hypothetical protein